MWSWLRPLFRYSPSRGGHRVTSAWQRGLGILLLVGGHVVIAPDRVSAQTTIDLEMTGKATSSGSTTTVADDDTIDWIITYRNLSGGVVHDVSISNVLSGNQTFVAGSAQVPPGWTFDEASQTFRAPVVCANNTATCGGTAVQSAGVSVNIGDTGGDGFAPVIHPANGRIYMTYHHVTFDGSGSANIRGPGIIQCVDTLTGGVCAGYPLTLQAGDPVDGFPETTGVSQAPEQIRFIGDQYYYPVYRLNSGHQPEWGLGCFDINSATPTQPGPCDGQSGRSAVGVNGFVRMGPDNTSMSIASADTFLSVMHGPWEIGSRLYLADFLEMRLYCYDLGTQQLCGAPYPVALAQSSFPVIPELDSVYTPPMAAEVLDSQLFIVVNYSNAKSMSIADVRVRCWDTATESFCWGTTVPSIAPGTSINSTNAFVRLNTAGDPDAICTLQAVHNSNGDGVGCTDLAGNAIASGSGHTRGVPNALLTRLGDTNGRGGGREVTVTHRTYFPSYWQSGDSAEGVVCWDWQSNAVCSGFGTSGLLTDGTSMLTNDYGLAQWH